MDELHRICRPGARIQLRTPHFSSMLAYSDPTHTHYFSAEAIRTLAEPRFSHYTAVRMRVVHVTHRPLAAVPGARRSAISSAASRSSTSPTWPSASRL